MRQIDCNLMPKPSGIYQINLSCRNFIYYSRVYYFSEECFVKIINSAVANQISTEQIDLIDARCFKHKVTVYFTQEEYRRVQDVLEQLRNSGLRGVTFSSLVRSTLYKHLLIVIEASVIERLNKEVQHNRGTTSGMATNPINRSNSKQKNKYSVKVMKGTQK